MKYPLTDCKRVIFGLHFKFCKVYIIINSIIFFICFLLMPLPIFQVLFSLFKDFFTLFLNKILLSLKNNKKYFNNQ